jgi:hypothetical protein
MNHGSRQQQIWLQKGISALKACQEAHLASADVDASVCDGPQNVLLARAAHLAANAWGSTIMEGRECCTSLASPYCLASLKNPSASIFLAILAVAFAVIFVASVATACRLSGAPAITNKSLESAPLTPKARKECTHHASLDDLEGQTNGRGKVLAPIHAQSKSKSGRLSSFASQNSSLASVEYTTYETDSDANRATLEKAWVPGYCLRVLPGAGEFARTTACLFNSMYEVFGFQWDNVRNQHEHLLSMWRSSCAMVADRSVGQDLYVDEERLLGEALGDLHVDLLGAFSTWREKLLRQMSRPNNAHAPDPKERSMSLGGISLAGICIPETACGLPAPVSSDLAKELTAQLAEIIAYLLVWGESGNLRFMPEFVYFIVGLILVADSEPDIGFSKFGAPSLAQHEAKTHSFLSRVVRPVYNCIFDEWYESVDVAPNGKDIKKMHPGFDKFLPADVANYDDWNEFFCDHKRLVEKLQLDDGTPFFALPPGKRFEALVHVNWHKSLRAAETKTHREIHSMWGVFAATHRIWLLHVALFFFTVCLVSREPPEWQKHIEWNALGLERFASLSLVVPTFAGLCLVAHWQITGHAFRQEFWARCLSWSGWFTCAASLLPLGTYAALRFLARTRAETQQTTLLAIFLYVNTFASICGLCVWLLWPSTNAMLWNLTKVSVWQRLLRYSFWLALLSGKFALGFIAVGAMHDAIADLHVTLPGLTSPTDFTQLYSGVDGTVHMTMWLLLWCTSFVLYVVDTQLWYVIGCTILGVVTAFAQRSFLCWRFALEDAVAKIPERFSRKVLYYAPIQSGCSFSPCFDKIWDRVVEFLRYEDSITDELLGNLSFGEGIECGKISWENVTRALGEDPTSAGAENSQNERLCKSGCGCLRRPGLDKRGKPHEFCCQVCAMHPGEGKHDERKCLGPPNKERAVGSQESTRQRANSMVAVRVEGKHAQDENRMLEMPDIFRAKRSCELICKHYLGMEGAQFPRTPDAQWRFFALSRSLGLPMPRPFRAPYFPGLTALIPHYGETIIMRKEELSETSSDKLGVYVVQDNVKVEDAVSSPSHLIKELKKGTEIEVVEVVHAEQRTRAKIKEPEGWITLFMKSSGERLARPKVNQTGRSVVPLMDWLKDNWTEEFASFTSRMQAQQISAGDKGWQVAGTQWDRYTDDQWQELCIWSSMRMQTLWRTVAGICLYHNSLQCHYEAQGLQCQYEAQSELRKSSGRNRLAHPAVWKASDCFTCLVSMQMYKFFSEEQFNHANRMLRTFPDCLKIAFIDSEEKGIEAELDGVHPNQQRRYFSCLTDKTCEQQPNGQRDPIFRIELPGYPILGDGKSDNQNHAAPFMRGTLAQCIDSNQGAYFEQMLLLPCVLGEFRTHKRGDGKGKQIVGFPEHITSNIGSVGDMAASAEQAFGTILQRSYAVLGARMHYGHPDIMNKLYMMQQGGVSKGTKTLNLSEDIFAGMDFTLRGEGRTIKHAEYFHLAKGRDLGFNTVLAFFSKLASGCGEQFITRQTFRLSQVLHLPEFLSFYYAHMGYYVNQFFVSWCCPLLVCCWLLVLVSDCEGDFDTFHICTRASARGLGAAEIMAKTISLWFSWLMPLFIVATSLPLVIELWMERSLKVAMSRLLKQMLTLSPLLFVFQAKVIGSYVINELRAGGATYVSTGRGLPTERRPFLGEPEDKGFRMKKVGGLYLDYASVAYYDGALLLAGCVLVLLAGGVSEAAGNGIDTTWAWASLSLVMVSWLFAPFLFNPYQFARTYFCDDLKSWVAFFTEKGGEHWIKWYMAQQSKMQVNKSSVLSTASLLICFLLLTWYATVTLKINALSILYSESIGANMKILTLLPPLGASLVYFMLVAVMTCCCQCFVRFSKTGSLSQTPPEQTDHQGKASCCNGGLPLVLSSILVFALDSAEAMYTLQEFYFVGWRKALIAGLVLKFILFTICMCVAEMGLCLLQHPSGQRCGCLGRTLALWVYAHRMGRDIAVSLLILIVLFPFVLLNTLNDSLCHGFNVHQLLIYRLTGQRRRENVYAYFFTAKTFKSEFRSERSGKTDRSARSERSERSLKCEP